jgi:hypothetical protein
MTRLKGTKFREISLIEIYCDPEGNRRDEVMLDIISVMARLISLKLGFSIFRLFYSISAIFWLLITTCISNESIKSVCTASTRLYGSTTEFCTDSSVHTSTPTMLFFLY